MLADKLDAILNRMKQVLLGVVGTVVLAILTILLLAPESVSDFIIDIPGLVRLLLVVVVYGGIGALGYSRLQNIQEGRQIRGLVVKSSGGALAELSVESAREQILKAVQELPTVISADATVAAKRGKAVITLNVEMKSDNVNLPDKQKEINRVLGNVIEKRLGLRMAERPMVQINLDGRGLPAAASPAGGTVTEPTAEVGSPVERLGRRIFGEKSEDQPEQQSSEASEEKEDPDDGADDETSGEFWDFLKSTASPSEGEDDEADVSPVSLDDDATSEVEEPITGLLDVDAPVIQDADSIAPEEDDDELTDTSS